MSASHASRLYLVKAFIPTALLLLLPPQARAQQYTIQNPGSGGYSGGKISGQISPISPYLPYSLPYTYNNGTYGRGRDTYSAGSTASCSGPNHDHIHLGSSGV